MALVAGGRSRIGAGALCDDDGRDGVPARVVEPIFYDKEGKRLDG